MDEIIQIQINNKHRCKSYDKMASRCLKKGSILWRTFTIIYKMTFPFSFFISGIFGSGRAISMCTILASIRDRITVISPIGVRFLLVHWYSLRCILSIFFFRFIFVISFRLVVNSTPGKVTFWEFHSMLTSCRTMFSGLRYPNQIHLVLSSFFLILRRC